MTEMLQNILLNPWVVGILLLGSLLVLSRWALSMKEYPGYALGILMGLFFILVYVSLGGGAGTPTEAQRTTLNIFEVVFSTFLGFVAGAGIMFGLHFGTRFARGISLQVAFYTALNLILLFMAIIAGPITQRMIGIFALAIGIASLFALVLFPVTLHHPQPNTYGAQSQEGSGDMPGQPAAGSMSRLDEIRQKFSQKNQR